MSCVGCLPFLAAAGCGSSCTVVIEHVCQDIFCVLETLGHLLVVAVKCLTQRHDRTFTSLVHVSYQSVVRVKKNFSMILEVDLYDFIA